VLFSSAAAEDGFSLGQCQADFCREGTDGYLSFLSLFVSVVRRYAVPLALCAAILVVLELILAFNLKTAAKYAHYSHQLGKETLKLVADSEARDARLYQQNL